MKSLIIYVLYKFLFNIENLVFQEITSSVDEFEMKLRKKKKVILFAFDLVAWCSTTKLTSLTTKSMTTRTANRKC
jgi:hypothetical protein